MRNKPIFLFLLSFILISFGACKKDDVTPPELVLEGGLVIEHMLNSTFVEPGYFATDYNEEEKETDTLTESVTVSALDVNVTGEQVITYTVSDAAGNTTTVERTVTVYNKMRKMAGFWQGDFIQPYQGTNDVQYMDSIAFSTTDNMNIIFTNFAGNTGANVLGTVISEGEVHAPLVRFASQTVAGKTFTAQDAPISGGQARIEIYYTLGSEDGYLVLDKK